MSKSTSTRASNGDTSVRNEQKKLRSHTHKETKRPSKKPMKSNITNKIGSQYSGTAIQAGETSDDDDGGGGSNEEQTSTTEEPDVPTLSGAWRQVGGEAAHRLAGSVTDDEMINDMQTNDATGAIVGAERDDELDSDDYEEMQNLSDSEASEDDDEDDNVLLSAEQDLIEEFERTEGRRNTNHVTQEMNGIDLQANKALALELSLHTSNNRGSFAFDMNNDPFEGYTKDNPFYQDLYNEAEDVLQSFWRAEHTARDREGSDPTTTPKRVRFEEVQTYVRDSSSSESEDPNEAFPDLFADADDPLVRQQLSLNVGLDLNPEHFVPADDESFYDFEDEDERVAFIANE